MANQVMQARDSVSAKMAECFVTVDGKRYNFMSAINLEATLERSKVEVPILGRMNVGHKSVGASGKGKATFHFNTSLFRQLAKSFQDSGRDMYFDMQVTNWDDTSDAGRQTVILRDCNLDSVTIAKFDAKGDYLEDSFAFTFESFEMPESFSI